MVACRGPAATRRVVSEHGRLVLHIRVNNDVICVVVPVEANGDIHHLWLHRSRVNRGKLG